MKTELGLYKCLDIPRQRSFTRSILRPNKAFSRRCDGLYDMTSIVMRMSDDRNHHLQSVSNCQIFSLWNHPLLLHSFNLFRQCVFATLSASSSRITHSAGSIGDCLDKPTSILKAS